MLFGRGMPFGTGRSNDRNGTGFQDRGGPGMAIGAVMRVHSGVGMQMKLFSAGGLGHQERG